MITDSSILSCKGSNSNSNSLAKQNYLALSIKPNSPLPPYLTIAQILSLLKSEGNSLSEPCLYLTLKQKNKDSKGIAIAFVLIEQSQAGYDCTMIILFYIFTDDYLKPNRGSSSSSKWPSINSTLEVFSAKGGLAVLAKYLPLVYPESNRPLPPIPSIEKSPTQEQLEADWVKIEHNENVYEDLEENIGSATPRPIPQTPQVFKYWKIF